MYVESINTLEVLDDGETNQYFDDNPRIIPLFEINIVDIITPYMTNEEKYDEILEEKETLDDKTLRELRLQQEAREKEMQVSHRVQASTLVELNLVDDDTEQCTVLI